MASPVDTSVKFALSSMAGASVINGQAGTRLAAIRAFAVTGFGTKSVDSGGVITGGKCRLPFNSGVSAAAVNSVIQVTGATPALLNGEQKVTAVSSAWVEFATALPDGAVTGSVSFKVAPLGWEEVFSKTNVSVFRPTDPTSSRPYFRIDDSNSLYAIVQMYESMTDVDTGFNGTPARYWNARSSASANGVSWSLIGDSRGLYVCIAPYSTSTSDYAFTTNIWYIGDQISDRSGDPYSGICMGNTTAAVASVDGVLFVGTATGNVMRISAGLGLAVSASISSGVFSNGVSGNDSSMGPFPSRSANALFVVPVYVADGGTFGATGRRGRLPGALHCPQTGVYSVYGGAPTQVAGTGDFAGKTLLSQSVGNSASTAPSGVGFIDLTGPWRNP